MDAATTDQNMDASMAVCSPLSLKPALGGEETYDPEGEEADNCEVEEEDDPKGGEEAAADDEYTPDGNFGRCRSRGCSRAFSELKDFLKQKRSCPPKNALVCKPHQHIRFGAPLYDVFSVTIWRNMEYDHSDSDIRIHGAMGHKNILEHLDFWFKRGKDDPQVFIKPGEKLTLALEGPFNPAVFSDRGHEYAVTCLLKYNDADIFLAPSHRTFEKGCGDLFGENNDIVGVGLICYCAFSSPETGVEIKQFDNRYDHPILDSVARVEAEIGTMEDGMVGMIRFRARRDLILYGEITARSCLFVNNFVLFEKKTQNEAVEVKLNEFIPLLRMMAAFDCRASLLIKVQLWDGKDTKILVDETVQFNVNLAGSTSQKTTSNGLIQIDVKWTIPRHNGYTHYDKLAEDDD